MVGQLHKEGRLPIVIRGQAFGLRELRIVLQCISEHKAGGRTKISEVVCTRLAWRQPNGWLKDRACRDALRRLEVMGLVELPPSLVNRKPGQRTPTPAKPPKRISHYDLESEVVSIPDEIHFVMAKGNQEERIWNYLVNLHHYLGHRSTVGRSIKYLILSGNRIIGAISFSSPTWRVASRDKILGHIGMSVREIHERVINNSRFLILPGVNAKSLASRLLSLSIDIIKSDWRWYYGVEPFIIETFVQPSLFDGTCYKAANWMQIGRTKGYAKVGAGHHNSQDPKQMYLYGMNRPMRAKLLAATKCLNLTGGSAPHP